MARKRSLQSLINEYGRDPEKVIVELGYGLEPIYCMNNTIAACTMMMNNTHPVINVNERFFADRSRFYNDEAADISRKAALAHEFAHAHTQQPALRQRGMIFDGEKHYVEHTLERAANIYAARFLIDLDELQESLLEGYSFRQIAKSLKVPVGFAVLRLEDLKRAKPELRIGRLPRVRDDFMACLQMADESDDLYE